MNRIAIVVISILLALAGALVVVFASWDASATDPADGAACTSAGAAPALKNRGVLGDAEAAASDPTREPVPEPPWAGADVIGMVVDRDGYPLAGAEVWLTLEDRHYAALTGDHAATLESLLAPRTTGADGRFRFERLPVRGRFHASARKSGFAPWEGIGASFLLSPGHATDLGRIVLDRASCISGVVVDREGRPVPGAQVDCLCTRFDPPAITDRDGRFEVADLKPGRYVLVASQRGFAPERRDQPVVCTLGRGEAWTDVRLVLARGRSVCGRVVGPSGTPLAGARVTSSKITGGVLFANGDSMGGHFYIDATQTDAAGRYVITAPATPNEEFWIVALAQGFAEASAPVHAPPGPEPVPVPDLIVAPSANPPAGTGALAIGGRVLDRNGAGIPGACVDLSGPVGRRDWTFTEVDGAFRFERMQAGAYTVVASTPDLSPVEVRDLPVGPDSGATDLEIVLSEAAGALAGIVIGLDGAPQPRMSLRAPHAGGKVATGESDAAGAFRIAPLAPGRHVLRVEPVDDCPDDLPEVEGADEPFDLVVQVAAGVESALTVDLRSSPYCLIEGTVRIRGEPAAGLDLGGARTDEAGSFRTSLLLAGDTRLMVWGENGAVARRDLVTAPGTIHTVDLDLNPASLEIRVLVGETGEPDCTAVIFMVQVSADGSEGPFAGCFWSANAVDGGVVLFEHLPAGRYEVEASTSPCVRDKLAPEIAVVDLVPGGTGGIILRRYPFASLRVRLEPPPAASQCVLVEVRSAFGATRRLHDSDFLPGTAEVLFDDLARGSYRVAVLDTRTEAELGAAEVTVHPSEEHVVVIELRQGAGQR